MTLDRRVRNAFAEGSTTHTECFAVRGLSCAGCGRSGMLSAARSCGASDANVFPRVMPLLGAWTVIIAAPNGVRLKSGDKS
jgi:hypothetical protein